MSNPFKINDLVKRFDDNDTIFIVVKTTPKTCHVRFVRVGAAPETYVAAYTEFYSIIKQGVPERGVGAPAAYASPFKEMIDVPKISPSLSEEVLKFKLSIDETIRAIQDKVPLESYTAAGWLHVQFPEHLNIKTISEGTYRYKPNYINIGGVEVPAPIKIQDKRYDDQSCMRVWGLSLNKGSVFPLSISSARYNAVRDKMKTSYWLSEDDARAALNALNSLLETK